MTTRYYYEVRQPAPHEIDEVQSLRHLVLDPARNTPTEIDPSEKDFYPTNINVAAFLALEVVSTVRIDKLSDDLYSVRKMATHPEFRLKGLGSRVLADAESIAVERGAKEFVLDARAEAIGFFVSLGYVATGEEITHNDGIPNFTMKKQADRA